MTEIIEAVSKLGALATVVAYCNDKVTESDNITKELTQLATDLEEWSVYNGNVKNTTAGGYVEASTSYFALAPASIIRKWEESAEMDEDTAESMETILDSNDGIFEDCNRYQEKVQEDLKMIGSSYFAQVKGRKNIAAYGEEPKVYPVYDITYPAPNFATTKDIMIEATNGVTHQKSRPLRRHETLAAIGHQERIHEWTGHRRWNQTYKRLGHTTPRHTWERIVTALHSFEIEHMEEEAGRTQDGQTPAETATATPTATPTEGDRHEGRDRHEGQRTMVTRVINRWMTLPEPTKEDWKNAIDTDHNLRRIKQALTTGTTVAKASLHEKRYYKEWQDDKLELEDGTIYQYEEPKATKIRQLRRRVVLTRLRNLIMTAYHTTPIAGHTGYYKTYWRIAARFFWPGKSRDV
jgi:hypothetical protein